MISTIITTHNRRHLLKKAIKSVLNQSEQDFEIIVVDDCSTDGTEELVKMFIEKHGNIRYFKTDKNYGFDSRPKNIGIREAKGEYITFLDDDDLYRKDAIKILSTYLKRSGADIVYGDYIIDGKPGWSVDFNISTLNKMNYISMPVVMVKRDILIEVGGFDEEIKKFKDWNLWLRLQKRGYKFLHIPIIVAEVSIQENSISNKYKEVKTTFNPADCLIYPNKTVLGKRPKLKVAVFTMTMNRLDYTKQMYSSLEKSGYPFDWFVIDQNSDDGTPEWLKGKGTVVENKENIGIANGWNKAAELCKDYDILVKIDNDAEMMSNKWLKTMIDIFNRNRNVVLSPCVEGLEDSPGGVLRKRDGYEPYVLINDKILGVVPFLGGIVWAAPIELYKGFKFDEGQFLAGNKDYIISQYAKGIGYTLFYVEELRVYHIDGTKGQHTKYKDYFKKQEEYKQKKYGENR